MKKSPAKKSKQNEASLSIPREIEDLIKKELKGKVGEHDIPAVAAQLTQFLERKRFSGPIPPPEYLREYENILQGSAERIMRMAELSHDHKRSLEKIALEASITDTKLGMYCGAILFALLILAGFGSLFVTDNVLALGIFMGTVAIGGISLFITRGYGRKRPDPSKKPDF